MNDKLFKRIRIVLDMGEVFSGISVSDLTIDLAIKRAKIGNSRLYKVLLEIIAERIEWWKECDINKALFAKETYDMLEKYYEEIIENE